MMAHMYILYVERGMFSTRQELMADNAQGEPNAVITIAPVDGILRINPESVLDSLVSVYIHQASTERHERRQTTQEETHKKMRKY